MTYNQQVMQKAHELYKASGERSRDMFAACLSVAHAMVKDLRARQEVVVNLMQTRRASSLRRLDRLAA